MSENIDRCPDAWYRSDPLEPSQAKRWYPGAAEPETSELGPTEPETPELGAAELMTPALPASADASAGPEAERERKAGKRSGRRARIIAFAVSGVLLLGALCVGIWHFIDGLNLRVVAYLPGLSEPSEPRIAGGDSFDDYKEFFSRTYTRTSETLMPRAATGTGVTLTLAPKPSAELSLQDSYDRVSPAVVGITTYIDGVRYGWGSGVVFTEDGYLITNTHILQSAEAAEATFPDGTVYPALLVGADSASDIAVLKLDGKGRRFPCAVFGDSSVLRVGDRVAAIGNPLGEEYAGTMTDGIISAISRDVVHNGYAMTLLQTNAAINEGNSGGPLVNACGQVIGITNMKIMATYNMTVEGIAFAVPSAVVKQVADELIAAGVVSGEPTIGITGVSVSPEAMARYGLPAGVYVSDVEEESDAYAQGLQVGDIIVAVDGVSVTSVAQITAAKNDLAVGDTIMLTVYRDGDRFEMEIALVDKLDLQ